MPEAEFVVPLFMCVREMWRWPVQREKGYENSSALFWQGGVTLACHVCSGVKHAPLVYCYSFVHPCRSWLA